MNKRYIDFVPAKKDIPKGGVAKSKSIKVVSKTEESAPKSQPKPAKKITRRVPAANPLLDEEVVVEEIFAEKKEPAKKAQTVRPKFVKTEVKKRPLGNKAVKPAMAKRPATAVKTAAISKAATPKAPTPKPIVAPKQPAPLGQRTKFLNTDKIEKRALGRTTNRVKSVPVPKIEKLEKPKKTKAPEKIIAKPEKDSKAGLIIAIILTIILGAAAGTVAFLLLPK